MMSVINAECNVMFNVMLSALMLSIVMLSVIMLSVAYCLDRKFL